MATQVCARESQWAYSAGISRPPGEHGNPWYPPDEPDHDDATWRDNNSRESDAEYEERMDWIVRRTKANIEEVTDSGGRVRDHADYLGVVS